MGLHKSACESTCFIADFSVCDMHVKCVSHACAVELIANLYRTLNIV